MKLSSRPAQNLRTAVSVACLFVGVALSGCSGSESAPSAPAADVSALPAGIDVSSTPQRRLITERQYVNTIANIFGPEIEIITQFAPMQRTDGLLALGAAGAGVPAGQMVKFQRAARQVATQIVQNGNLALRLPSQRTTLIPCKPADAAAPDDACARIFLSAVGRLLYRRPVADARLDQLIAEAAKSAKLAGNFYTGLSMVIEGMLLSPEVLFITDRSEPDPARPGRLRLDAYSYASRLSFFLWDSAPDGLLLEAAERGALSTLEGRTRIIDMMLASPRLEDGVHGFFDDMLHFDSFANLAKDPNTYPAETGLTLTDAREQTLRTIYYHLVTRNADYRDLFTSRTLLMSPSLGVIYGVPTKPGWHPYTFPDDSPRAGLLTHVSFLALHAHPARSSPTRRGKELRELLLCQRVPLPPPNVDFSALENPKAEHRTQRDRVNFHLENPVCAGCHRITDPIGLALENFDGAGQYRTTEKGAVIDASGSLDGRAFRDAAGLGQALHDHPSLPSCLARRAYSYGIGASAENDKQAVDYFTQKFAASGYRFRTLLREVALSPAFYTLAAPTAALAKEANNVPQPNIQPSVQ